MPGVFITGTDTGVGKTHITYLLAKELLAEGLDVGVMKPISAGSLKDNDAVFLKKELNLSDPLELINPVRIKKPLAPYAANLNSRGKVALKKIFSAYKQLSKKHKLVLVEGVGGALVPINKNYFVADLIKELGIPAIIVARAGLGTINHTLLTLEALATRKIPILGIILNGFTGKDPSEKTNGKAIERLTGVPILAKLAAAKPLPVQTKLFR